LRELVKCHGGQFPIVSAQGDRIAEYFVVEVAVMMQAVAVDDPAGRQRRSSSTSKFEKPHAHLVLDLDSIARLQGLHTLQGLRMKP